MAQKITLKIDTFILLLISALVIPFFIGRMQASNPILLRLIAITVGPAFVGFMFGFGVMKWMMEGRRRRRRMRGERVRFSWSSLLKEGMGMEVVDGVIGLVDGGEKEQVVDTLTLKPSTPSPVVSTPQTGSSPSSTKTISGSWH